MLLTIDIGNSQVVWGAFQDSKLVGSWRLATTVTKTADEYGILLISLLQEHGFSPTQITGSIISSVVPPLTPVFQKLVKSFFHHAPLVVDIDFPLGITLQYENPQEIGTDRLVNAAAGFHIYQTGIIIVDFGTATTFCTVTEKGEYLGGAIAPGLKSAADSLHVQTAKLPTVDLTCPDSVIGKDTVSSIQAGLIFGFTGLVDEIVTRIQKEVTPISMVVATGGLAPIIAPISRTIHEVRSCLTLEGLEFLYNKSQSSP